jgi:DNA-binding transcriptional regulator YhcF (GntR family)
MFHIDPNHPTPLYAQLERSIRFAIAIGKLGIGEQLPTVRALAVELSVNPNTVIKAEPKRIRPADKKRDRPEIVTEAKPEQLVERKHEPARKFIARLGTEHDPMTLAGQRKHVADKKHLTSYQNPQNFSEETRPSIGSLLQSGIEMDELNFLYITQLADELAALVSRLDALENRPANRRP